MAHRSSAAWWVESLVQWTAVVRALGQGDLKEIIVLSLISSVQQTFIECQDFFIPSSVYSVSIYKMPGAPFSPCHSLPQLPHLLLTLLCALWADFCGSVALQLQDGFHDGSQRIGEEDVSVSISPPSLPSCWLGSSSDCVSTIRLQLGSPSSMAPAITGPQQNPSLSILLYAERGVTHSLVRSLNPAHKYGNCLFIIFS